MKSILKSTAVVICLISVTLLASHCGKKDKPVDTTENPDPDPNPNPDPGPGPGRGTDKDEWQVYSTTTKPLGIDNWSFSIGNKIYFGAPLSNVKVQVYNVDTKAWEPEIEGFTWFQRIRPHITVHEGKAYIGGGHVDIVSHLDWYEFDPAATTEKWKRLADFILPQDHGHSFVVNDTMYSGLSMGFDDRISPLQTHFYRYSLKSDTWKPEPVQINSIGGTSGFSFMLNNEFYYGAGYFEDIMNFQETQACHKYVLGSRQVQRIADFPVKMKSNANAIAFTSSDRGYVLAAGSHLYQYNPVSNKWLQYKEPPNDGPENPILYVHKTGEKVFGFTPTGKVFQYIYK